MLMILLGIYRLTFHSAILLVTMEISSTVIAAANMRKQWGAGDIILKLLFFPILSNFQFINDGIK